MHRQNRKKLSEHSHRNKLSDPIFQDNVITVLAKL